MIEKIFILASTGSTTLNSVLSECLNYTSEYFVKILLTDSGTYSLDRRFSLHCNLKISGTVDSNGNKSTISFKKTAFPDVQTGKWGDSFIGVSGAGVYYVNGGNKSIDRLQVSIENVQIKLVDGNFPGNTDYSELLLLSLRGCCKINLFNTDLFLKQGPITNIDIRESDNITISGCIVENRNGRSSSSGTVNNKVGGVLWIRGGCRNVRIFGNRFYKNGNDEMLGIWGGSQKEYSMEDIEIVDNLMEYGNASETAYSIDVLIAFTSDIDSSTVRRQNWKNLTFARNIIQCNAVVRRCMWLTFQTCDDIENIRISDNSFLHNAYISTASDGYVEDIEIRRISKSLSEGTYNGVRISNNQFVAKETIVHSNGHRNIILTDSKAYINNNIVDASAQLTQISGKTTKGSTFLSLSGATDSAFISSNRIIGTCRLIQSFSSSLKRATIECCNNYISGSSEIYLRHTVTEANVLVKGNTIENGTYYPFFQESARSGRIVLTDNVYIRDRSATNGGVLFEQYGTSENPSFSCVVVTGNTFVGYKTTVTDSAKKLGSNVYIGNNLTF